MEWSWEKGLQLNIVCEASTVDVLAVKWTSRRSLETSLSGETVLSSVSVFSSFSYILTTR